MSRVISLNNNRRALNLPNLSRVASLLSYIFFYEYLRSLYFSFLVELLRTFQSQILKLLTAPLLLSRAASHRSVGVEKNDRLLTVHIQMITRKDLFLHLFHALINEL